MKEHIKIKELQARQVFDSRGNPTVETELWTTQGYGMAMVPSGASTGIHEAWELRDKKKAFGGKGVTKAVNHINNAIRTELRNKSYADQDEVDETLQEMDGTPQKRRLGANAILGTSMAFSRAVADHWNIPLYEYFSHLNNSKPTIPIPFCNIINGGVHAGNALEMQEFMIAPTRAKNFSSGVQAVVETYHELKNILRTKYGKNATNVGDEGGFAPPIKTADEALKLLTKAIDASGYTNELQIAMDAAAGEFFNKTSKTYLQKKLTAHKLGLYYERLIERYPICSLEDPFDQDDFAAWKDFKPKIQVVGDDLTVTNPSRVEFAANQDLCNALLLKINQIGTITQSIHAAQIAQHHGWHVMVSHRSGETEDPFIADLAVGLAAGQIKLGAPCRSDRVAKYNQLLRIEDDLGKKAKYAKFIQK